MPPVPETKETLVIREVPPKQPAVPDARVITIPGKLLPPPARKVIVERLPELPEPPQDVHIERWLPFQDRKRKVILNPKPCDPIQCQPRNLVINWEKVNKRKLSIN